MKTRLFASVAALTLLGLLTRTEARRHSGIAELRQRIERLRVVGSVLMIAAHPDDENTAVLTWCAQERKVRTGYLSLTRGEGGQNLIGSEQGEMLGLIRTQELLAARRIDGAEQYFTRAIDFGFSKTAEETLRIWGKEEVLSDVVRVIRAFRPDVIVLRFSGTSRDGHGHHQASALLGKEAFRAAADATRFPEQLKTLQPWQARRVVWNGFAFNRQQETELQKMTQRVQVDTGAYNAVLGVSYGELAGLSRSQHRSQGMGAPERRGSVPNYFVAVDGEPAQADLFDGIDLSWNRLPDGARVDALLREAAAALTFDRPEAVAPVLAKARAMMAKIDHPDARRKLEEADEAIAAAAGLWLDVSANRDRAPEGAEVQLSMTALNRSPLPATLVDVKVEGLNGIPAFEIKKPQMNFNQPLSAAVKFTTPAGAEPTQPYWLRRPARGALYAIEDPEWIGRAENPPVLSARFVVDVAGTRIELRRPVENRFVDRVRGELTRPFVIVPAVSVELAQSALLFPERKARQVEVTVRSHGVVRQAAVRLLAPKGWAVAPTSRTADLPVGETRLAFEVTPPSADSRGELKALVETAQNRATYTSSLLQLDYEHIPPQTLLRPAATPVVRADISMGVRRVGYIMGAGDEAPETLKQLGCEITQLGPAELAKGDFSGFDAIVTGVRSWNTRADLRANAGRLWEYLNNGGTVVVQYNVMDGLFWSSEPGTLRQLGPYAMKTGRDRVTVEDAPVRFLKPDHALLQWPNRITQSDFTGWVQERGLYFPVEWDTKYETLLEMNDPGEKPLAAAILTARVGKGVYVFTPLSFFRQLPAGVPGAVKLFANLVSAGHAARP